jgi:hypothetical protein
MITENFGAIKSPKTVPGQKVVQLFSEFGIPVEPHAETGKMVEVHALRCGECLFMEARARLASKFHTPLPNINYGPGISSATFWLDGLGTIHAVGGFGLRLSVTFYDGAEQ